MNKERIYNMRVFGIDIDKLIPKLTDDEQILLFKIHEAQRIANLGFKERVVKNVNGFVEGGFEVDLQFSKECCVAWE